jgi:hypothetical protein
MEATKAAASSFVSLGSKPVIVSTFAMLGATAVSGFLGAIAMDLTAVGRVLSVSERIATAQFDAGSQW